MALRNLGIEHEVVAIAEIDKFAIKSYEAIHGVTNNLGDISKINTEDIPDHDLFTYSFPCQDISVAGKGLGLDEGSDTRSGLLWECQKVIAVKKPKYLLLENVKNLVGKKHKHNFDKWLEWLSELGYTNYWEVLNAKDYGIPQNRERVFVVSILGEHEPYEFPKPVSLELRLKDVLEDEVDEKFYLDQERVDKLIVNSDKLAIGYIPRKNGTQHQSNIIYKTDAESPSMQARDYKDPVKVLIENETNPISEPKIEQVAQYDTPTRKNSNRFRTYDKRGISPSITTMGGGGLEPHVMLDEVEGIPIKNATKKGYINACDGDGVDLAYPDSKTRRGRVQKKLSQTLDTSDSKGVVIGASRGRNPENPSDRTVGSPTEQRLEINKQGTSNTITTVQKDNYVVYNNYRIRKLTPKECWRLMGCSDEDFHKAEQVNSNSQLYKQAGNAIVVDVLEGIFSKLFGGSK